MKNKKKILLIDLKKILENNKINEVFLIKNLNLFDSIMILQIINLAKTKYNKNINGLSISKCKKISEIIDLII